MDFERLSGDLKELRRRNRTLGAAVGLLAAGHVLALAVVLNLLGAVRTVVVPPSINKSFWVTRDKASGEYLERRARGAANRHRVAPGQAGRFAGAGGARREFTERWRYRLTRAQGGSGGRSASPIDVRWRRSRHLP